MCEIYTAQIGRYTGIDAIDTTVKSATGWAKLLTPTWEIVKAVKSHAITEVEYTQRYYAMLRGSYIRYPERFLEFLESETITLMCYCRPGVFCHRHLLAKTVFPTLAKERGLDVVYMGERVHQR